MSDVNAAAERVIDSGESVDDVMNEFGFDDYAGCRTLHLPSTNSVAYLHTTKSFFINGRVVSGIDSAFKLRLLIAAIG